MSNGYKVGDIHSKREDKTMGKKQKTQQKTNDKYLSITWREGEGITIDENVSAKSVHKADAIMWNMQQAINFYNKQMWSRNKCDGFTARLDDLCRPGQLEKMEFDGEGDFPF